MKMCVGAALGLKITLQQAAVRLRRIPRKEFLIDLLFARYAGQTPHFLRNFLIVSPWTMIENTTTM
jgi:hypothetical protein